jgi:hypothetical protein
LPRSPPSIFERSYSDRRSSLASLSATFFIVPSFAPCGLAGADDPNPLPSICVCDNQHPSILRSSDRNETVLRVGAIRIMVCNGSWICHNCGRLVERDIVACGCGDVTLTNAPQVGKPTRGALATNGCCATEPDRRTTVSILFLPMTASIERRFRTGKYGISTTWDSRLSETSGRLG